MKKTPFFESHKKQGAKFIAFAGWQMPFSYQSPALEHHQTRTSGGLFDVSHMGQIRIKGSDSLSFLQKLLPSDLTSLKKGQALYSVLCSEEGGLIDDLIVYACSPEKDYLLCVNSATKDKDLEWIKSHAKEKKVDVRDESESWAMIAVQGPKSFELCEKIFPSVPFRDISKFHFTEQESCLFSRTGYTGEEGFEIYIPWEKSTQIWNQFIEEGQAFSISPIGLGARDTLRLEMGYLLSGQDFDESKSPLQAGLSWLIKNRENFIGSKALLKQKTEGHDSKLKGFVIEEMSGVPRKACSVFSSQGELIGTVTSGAKSPSLEKMIGLAYIKGEEKECWIDIRGSKVKAKIVRPPFLNKKI